MLKSNKIISLVILSTLSVFSSFQVAQAQSRSYAWFEHPIGTVFGSLAQSNPSVACQGVYNAMNNGTVTLSTSYGYNRPLS